MQRPTKDFLFLFPFSSKQACEIKPRAEAEQNKMKTAEWSIENGQNRSIWNPSMLGGYQFQPAGGGETPVRLTVCADATSLHGHN
jgi:hypothetical protein